MQKQFFFAPALQNTKKKKTIHFTFFSQCQNVITHNNEMRWCKVCNFFIRLLKSTCLINFEQKYRKFKILINFDYSTYSYCITQSSINIIYYKFSICIYEFQRFIYIRKMNSNITAEWKKEKNCCDKNIEKFTKI
jgi:hypothetical protein